jgi:hypothetical protein
MAKEYVTETRFELTEGGRFIAHTLASIAVLELIAIIFMHGGEVVHAVGTMVDVVTGPFAGAFDLLEQIKSIDPSGLDIGNPAHTAGLRDRTIPTITSDPNGVFKWVQNLFGMHEAVGATPISDLGQ